MKIKEGFVMREVAGQTVVIAVGESSKQFRGMIYLNDTGKCVWTCIQEGLEEAAIVEKIVQMYDVNLERATQDVREMVQQMLDAGVIEQ